MTEIKLVNFSERTTSQYQFNLTLFCPHRGATDLSRLPFTSTNLMRFVNKDPANSRTVDDSLMSSKVLKQQAWKPPGRYERALKNSFII